MQAQSTRERVAPWKCPASRNRGHSLNTRVRLPPEKLPATRPPHKLTRIDDRSAAGQHRFRNTLDLNPFEHGIVHAHVVRLHADHLLFVGIENNQIGVRPHRNRALARKQAEEFCRRSRDNFHEAVRREPLTVNASRVDKAQAMLNAWTTVRNLGEVIDAQFLLFLKQNGQ